MRRVTERDPGMWYKAQVTHADGPNLRIRVLEQGTWGLEVGTREYLMLWDPRTDVWLREVD